MKFIKKYEALIRNSDSRALNHVLLPLSNAIEEMLKTLVELQNGDHTKYPIGKIKKYFSDKYDTTTIKLSYEIRNINRYKIGELFTITLSSNNYRSSNYSMNINATNNETNGRSKRLEIERRLQEFMEKYVSRSNYLYAGGKNEFTINDIPDIIDEFKKITSELQIEISRNKYNI